MVDHSGHQTAEPNRDGEITVKDLIIRIKTVLTFLRNKWMFILLFVILGAGLGFGLAATKTTKYMAQSIFVLDEANKKTSMGGLAMLGIDLGGGSSAGLFSGTKNILWLYSSRPMIKKVLLSKVERNGKQVLLIDWFLEESKLIKNYPKGSGMAQNVTDSMVLSPEQNALISNCFGVIVSKYLKVGEEEGTDNMIKVTFVSRDELFSKAFTEVLVNAVNQFYIQSKTLKISEEVAILQRKADSVRSMMNSSMYQAASATDAAPNANPNLQVLRVAPQRKSIDVSVNTTLYIELMKNLESRHMSMAQETPLIQVIDTPSLPLDIVKPSPKTYAILGGFLSGFIAVVVLIVLFIYRKVMAS